MRASRAAAGVVLGLLAACSSTPPAVRFDLGPVASVKGDSSGTAALLVAVHAPAWLDGNAIVYRLAYDDPRVVHAYALSEWVAPPAELIGERLHAAPVEGARHAALADGPIPVVRIEIEEFSQVFDAPQSSRFVLRARATRTDGAVAPAGAERTFTIERPAPSADAAGAVRAAGAAVDALCEALVAWVAGAPEQAAEAQARTGR